MSRRLGVVRTRNDTRSDRFVVESSVNSFEVVPVDGVLRPRSQIEDLYFVSMQELSDTVRTNENGLKFGRASVILREHDISNVDLMWGGALVLLFQHICL